MKKIIFAIVIALAMGCGTLTAKESDSIYKKGDKVITFEATGGILGFGLNEVVTFDFMRGETFGIGAGIAVSEGLVATIDGFLDIKLNKWNLGIGGGYNYQHKSQSFIFRAVHHGNEWDWGPMKAGLAIGCDWHLFSAEGSFSTILGILPRFIIGVNCQLIK